MPHDNGEEIGDVNQRTHGVEFYGTSSNHVLLNQLFSFARRNRRHTRPSSPSVINLLSTEDPLLPSSRRATPPPVSQEITPSINLFATNAPSSNPPAFPASLHTIPPEAAKRHVERELVRSYLHNLHLLHPVLDASEFIDRCEGEVWSPRAEAEKSSHRSHFNALFNIVVAIGALVAGPELKEEFSQELSALAQSEQHSHHLSEQSSLQSFSRSYFQKARASLGDVFEVCSLESAQALLLMVSLTVPIV